MRFLDTPTLAAYAVLAATVGGGDADAAAIPTAARGEPDASAAAAARRPTPIHGLTITTSGIRVVALNPGATSGRCCRSGEIVFQLCRPEEPPWLVDAPSPDSLAGPATTDPATLTSPAAGTAPVLRLAIVRCTRPGVRPLALDVALPDRDGARLEVIDVAGRRAFARDLDGLAPGIHRVSLEEASLASGVYWARLAQRGRQSVAKVVIVR